MKLKDYTKEDIDTRREIANAIRCNVHYLRQLETGRRAGSAEIWAAIETATKGKVTVRENYIPREWQPLPKRRAVAARTARSSASVR
jgi:DNA-binding transcriptional regulator YdaS (Cro superfamily)